jgi:hypothetical protein
VPHQTQPAHSSDQVFYFDQRGFPRRVDYQADILGGVPVAHYSYDHQSFAGLVVPTRRRAYPRGPDGKANLDRTFIELTVLNVSLL